MNINRVTTISTFDNFHWYQLRAEEPSKIANLNRWVRLNCDTRSLLFYWTSVVSLQFYCIWISIFSKLNNYLNWNNLQTTAYTRLANRYKYRTRTHVSTSIKLLITHRRYRSKSYYAVRHMVRVIETDLALCYIQFNTIFKTESGLESNF